MFVSVQENAECRLCSLAWICGLVQFSLWVRSASRFEAENWWKSAVRDYLQMNTTRDTFSFECFKLPQEFQL
jgi:hypothetical protein